MSYNFPEEEQKVLKFWKVEKIFEKLQAKNKGKEPWSFLDGPITANNPMGVHHVWGRTYKDFFQRYKAMQGFDERYQNGFDCQGLWVEVEVEKELGFKNKKDIERYGIDKFIEKCKQRVAKYSAILTKQSIRMGQWMDWQNTYYTMSDENNYAIWHFLKKCWEDGYLYKGRDSVPWCPRCGTAISQHEILTEEYKEILHDSIYFELPITGSKNEYLLVWTTTPWTLPANIAVAVDQKIDYTLVEGNSGDKFWVAKDLAQKIFKKDYKILKTKKGRELVGLKYSFAFDKLPSVEDVAQKNPGKFHTVIATDERILPITTVDGTGLVHIAVSAGHEDFLLGKKLELPLIEVIDEDASYLTGLGEFSGQNAKTNPRIILDYLVGREKNGEHWVFEILPYRHKYPTCWRCKTELVWRVVDEWYISMEKLRKPLVGIVNKIKWIPSFGKERELDWLKNMQDWLISKKRYWGLALPIFECVKCGSFEVIGSKEELKERAVEGWDKFEGNSAHRPWVDQVKIKCKNCGQTVSRIKDVGNPWLDAGIVPFSTIKYFSNRKYWEGWFPAAMVAESFPGQFKNWFYSLLVMSAVLENTNPMKTIFGYAAVRDKNGEEMHKSKGNAVSLDEATDKTGIDPIRWMYLKQNPAENVNFSYDTVAETTRRLLTLLNTFSFFQIYVDKKDIEQNWENLKPSNKLDQWILSRLNHVIANVSQNLDSYNPASAALAIEDFFICDLSLWYVRRSRKRFHLSSGSTGQSQESSQRYKAIATLYRVLMDLVKLLAPAMPFFAEQMYQQIKLSGMPKSVHLLDWPISSQDLIDKNLEKNMEEARSIVNLTLAQRAAEGIKVRQPLSLLEIKDDSLKEEKEILEIIKDEVNVREIKFNSKIKQKAQLDTKITEALAKEGSDRDLIHALNLLRKEHGLKQSDLIEIIYSTAEVYNQDNFLAQTQAKNFKKVSAQEIDNLEAKGEVKLKNGKNYIGFK